MREKQVIMVVALIGAIILVAEANGPVSSSWGLSDARWAQAANETLDMLSLDRQEWSVLSLRTLAEGLVPKQLQTAPDGKSFSSTVAEVLRQNHRMGDVMPVILVSSDGRIAKVSLKRLDQGSFCIITLEFEEETGWRAILIEETR